MGSIQLMAVGVRKWVTPAERQIEEKNKKTGTKSQYGMAVLL
jgi:hypothetical protein